MEKVNLNTIMLDRMAFVSNSKVLAGDKHFQNMWICGSSTHPSVSFNSMHNAITHD